jgi:hypothetical protein
MYMWDYKSLQLSTHWVRTKSETNNRESFCDAICQWILQKLVYPANLNFFPVFEQNVWNHMEAIALRQNLVQPRSTVKFMAVTYKNCHHWAIHIVTNNLYKYPSVTYIETAIKLYRLSSLTHIFLDTERQNDQEREEKKWHVFTRIDGNFYVKTSKIKQPHILI